MKIDSGIKDYKIVTTFFYDSKWVVGYNKKVFKLNVGDVIETKYGLELHHRRYKRFKINAIQSNGYASVDVLDIDISVGTAIPFNDIICFTLKKCK